MPPKGKSNRPPSSSSKDVSRDIDPDPQVRSLNTQISKLERELSALKEAGGDLKLLFDELHRSIEPLEPWAPLHPTETPDKSAQPLEAVIHFTDWHYGKVTTLIETEGLYANNCAILDHRLQYFLDTYQKIIETQRTAFSIPRLRVLVTGDMMNGELRREDTATNEWPSPPQAIIAGDRIAKSIRFLSTLFDHVTVEFLTTDNHSRLAKKVECSEAGLNSWGYVVGFHAKALSANIDNVDWRIHPSIYKIVEVQNLRYLITHGHMVKGWGGKPYYGFDRQVDQASRVRMNLETEYQFHTLISGHFHEPAESGWWRIGGSLTGTDTYDHACNRSSDPVQTCWFVHPQHGEMNYNKIHLPTPMHLANEGFPQP